MGRRFPDHCCCCSLRPGAVVIACFVLAISFPFMILMGLRYTELRSKISDKGTHVKDAYMSLVAMYWLNAALNAVEVLMTAGLLYGIYKRKERWITRWLFVTVGWWTEHSVFSLSILISSSRVIDLLCATFLGPFLFFLGYRCLKTVAGLRAEMLSHSDVENPRPVDRDSTIEPSTTAGAAEGTDTGADDNVPL